MPERFSLLVKSLIYSENFLQPAVSLIAGGLVLRNCCAVIYEIVTLIGSDFPPFICL